MSDFFQKFNSKKKKKILFVAELSANHGGKHKKRHETD